MTTSSSDPNATGSKAGGPKANASFAPYVPEARPGIHELLGVEVVEASPEQVVMRLPIDWKVHQPYGLLHGGVSALLAESAASLGGALAAGPSHGVVGIELNASHLRSLRDGHLTATATPLRVGRTVQVWRITLTGDDGRTVCEARCSLAVIDPPDAAVVESAAAPRHE